MGEEQYLSNTKTSDDQFFDISKENVRNRKHSLSSQSDYETNEATVVESVPEVKRTIVSKEIELRSGDGEINIEIKDNDLTHLPDVSFISEPQNGFAVDDLAKDVGRPPSLHKESKKAVIEQLIRTIGKETKWLNGCKNPNVSGVNNPVFIVEDEYDA